MSPFSTIDCAVGQFLRMVQRRNDIYLIVSGLPTVKKIDGAKLAVRLVWIDVRLVCL